MGFKSEKIYSQDNNTLIGSDSILFEVSRCAFKSLIKKNIKKGTFRKVPMYRLSEEKKV